ncbi:hypothetical protein [Bifidobacterium sp.]|jgi:ABC-type transport system involved in cytochrome bd biosynthesis fused ATPase/permease subunit|uniref:hypothetical protein n=1 Tax=Bifidobacterium sp. TaxID=41200 RepID=UPI0025BA2E9D|nr:hypothetical protein [Bifidobacterium sp.]MCH4208628.1 hypothetical protein [Bifidobacterium sp.]MCI1224399.1 hypothetical protein [Bifidobacterium sp.]
MAVKRFGNGLDRQLGAPVGRGRPVWRERQRLVLRDAPLGVLDEPTSTIDAQTEAEIFDDLRCAALVRIIIVAFPAHRRRAAGIAIRR